MNKIAELASLKNRVDKTNDELLNKTQELARSTGRFVFSVDFRSENDYTVVVRDKRQNGQTVELDPEGSKELHLFLSNIFDEPKIADKVIKSTKKYKEEEN